MRPAPPTRYFRRSPDFVIPAPNLSVATLETAACSNNSIGAARGVDGVFVQVEAPIGAKAGEIRCADSDQLEVE